MRLLGGQLVVGARLYSFRLTWALDDARLGLGLDCEWNSLNVDVRCLYFMNIMLVPSARF